MDGDAGTRRMINRWIGPGSDVGLSQEVIRSLYGLILSVDWEGNFSTFDPELLSVASDRYGSFNLGNLKDLSLVESTHTDQFRRLMADMSSGVDTCHKGCEYFGLCGGGIGSNRFWEHGTLASSETNACRFGTQIPVQVLLERVEAGPPLTHQPTH